MNRRHLFTVRMSHSVASVTEMIAKVALMVGVDPDCLSENKSSENERRNADQHV